jgi:hypothetical protein
MIISEKKLRRIVNEILNEFRQSEKNVDLDFYQSKPTTQQVSAALDKALGGTHVSGRKFHPAFLNSLNESKQAVDFADDELLKRVHELSMMSISGDITPKYLEFSDGTEIQSPDLEIVKSILAFTGGHVPSVRNPEVFDATKTGRIKRTYTVPNKNDYVTANIIMTRLASAHNSTGLYNEIYRGITLDQNIAKFLDPGIEFNNWPISSFTINDGEARDFIKFEDTTTEAGVLLSIEKPDFGCYIKHLSVYPSEDEYVLGKKLIIKSVRKPVFDARVKMYFVNCKIKE